MSIIENKNPKTGSIAHNLGNAISKIRIRIRFLRENRNELILQDEYLRRNIESIEREADSAYEIIKELEEYSLSAEEQKTFSIDELIKTAILESNVPDTIKISIKTFESVSLGEFPITLKETFKNLIINAVEAIENRGNIFIRTEYLNNMLIVEIEDTGKGIANAVRPFLFKPFFSTKEDDGHGLGLYWSRAYLRSLGGNIEYFKSASTENTVFRITVPVDKPE